MKNKLNIKKPNLFFLGLIVLVLGICFRLTLFKNLIPFPSRALVAKYYPWNTMPSFGLPYKDSDFTDAFRQQLPWKSFFITGIKQAKLNLWNPHAFSGYPLFANLQSAYFTPFNISYLLFGLLNGWTINIILILFFAGLFTFLFLKQLGFKSYLCFLGSLGFMFSSYLIHWLEWTVVGQSAIFLPLCLYAIEKVFRQKKPKFILFYILGVSFSVFGGRIQTAVYVVLFSWLYFFIRIKKEKYKKALSLVLFTFIALLISSIQLIPSLEFYKQTPRGDLVSRLLSFELLMPFEYLITIFIPDFFGNPGAGNFWGQQFAFRAYFGLSFIFFYFYALFFHKNNFVKKLKILNIVFLFLALKSPVTKIIPYLNLPIISSSDPSRILFLYEFSAVLISIFGIQLFFKEKRKLLALLKSQVVPILVYLASILFVFLQLKVFSSSIQLENLKIALRNSILPIGIYFSILFLSLAYSKLPKIKNIFIAALIFFTIFEYLYFTNKYLPFGEKKYVFPRTIHIKAMQNIIKDQRFVCTPGSRFEKNFATYHSLNSPEGYDSLSLKRYGELVAYIRQDNVFEQIPRADADVIYYKEDRHNLDFKRLLELLSVKYILGWAGEIPYLDTPYETDFKSVWDWQFSHIYEYKDSLARFYLVNDFEVIKDDKQTLEKLFSKDFNPSEKIILEEDPNIKLAQNKKLESKIDVLLNKPDTIILKVASNQRAILLINDNYYPGWKAFTDSQENFENNVETKIYRANYTFRAVLVSEGDSFIKLTYKPLSFKLGMVLSISGTLILIYLMLVPTFKLNEKN